MGSEMPVSFDGLFNNDCTHVEINLIEIITRVKHFTYAVHSDNGSCLRLFFITSVMNNAPHSLSHDMLTGFKGIALFLRGGMEYS